MMPPYIIGKPADDEQLRTLLDSVFKKWYYYTCAPVYTLVWILYPHHVHNKKTMRLMNYIIGSGKRSTPRYMLAKIGDFGGSSNRIN
jgi:hypothetical protein